MMDDVLKSLTKELLEKEVPFMQRSSGRIARMIKHEIGLEELKANGRGKKAQRNVRRNE